LEEDRETRRPFADSATARGLTKQTAGPLTIGEPPAPGGPDPAILQAVADLDEGRVSGVVQTADGVSIARVTRRIPESVPPLEEVRDAIRERLIRERARAAARQAAEALRAELQERLSSGLRFEEAVLADGVSVRTARFSRTQPIDPIGYERTVNDAAFATPLGRLTPVLETVRGFAVLRTEERIPPDESAFAGEEAALRNDTLSRRQEERFAEWMEDVRARARLKSFVESPPLEP
jgi:peptidyl-prolyl cis-trans isomerase D